MIKKIFALVMVISVLGIFASGCKKDDADAGATTTGTATTTGAAPAPAATTTGDAK